MKSIVLIICTGLFIAFQGCSSEKAESEYEEQMSEAMEEVEEAMEEVEEAMEEVEEAMDEVELALEDVPEIVRQAFDEAYASVEEVQWEMEGEYFEAEFDLDGKEIGIYFNSDGIQVAREEEIELSELPEAVSKVLNSEYQDFEIDEIGRIESEDEVLYEIELETENIEAEILIDSEGNIREKREEYEDDEDM